MEGLWQKNFIRVGGSGGAQGGRTSFLVLFPRCFDALNHKGSTDLSPLGVRAAALARDHGLNIKYTKK